MKILLLVGGDSSEREVSLDTGRAIYESLKKQGHQLMVVDPATGQKLLDHEGRYLEPSADQHGQSELPTQQLIRGIEGSDLADTDVVFLALHGGAGENGSIQNLLDLAGKRYTGSGMTASAVSMNKAIAKRLFGSIGVRTPEWKFYDASGYESTKSLAEKIALEHAFPLIVKPNSGGSTVGLSKVNSADELPDALKQAMNEDRKILIERYIPGRELTVAVLDNHAFPVVEIRPTNELYDYEAKYTKGRSEYIAPAEIPEDISEAVKSDAVKVFAVVGASGLARVDFIWADPREHYCLEINSLPGMTSLSLAPMAAACEGIDFDRLLEMIIDSALKK